ncbi:hypothetical protein DB347_25425 [Opitutaceae bacterium EW11]|nr:hypothetical protein DB347_25425 [Opitutaceae bacterium EW11]
MKPLLVLLLLVFTTCLAAERPAAAPGFEWLSLKEMHCDVQVPIGWNYGVTTVENTKVLRVSPAPVVEGRGIDVGFTLNVIRAKSQKEWQTAMEFVGTVMGEIREATVAPIQSTVKEEDGMLIMIVEGERFLPKSPRPEKKYHVRTVARAFGEYKTVYVYSFGAPVDEWPESWKKGSAMLNPVFFRLSK